MMFNIFKYTDNINDSSYNIVSVLFTAFLLLILSIIAFNIDRKPYFFIAGISIILFGLFVLTFALYTFVGRFSVGWDPTGEASSLNQLERNVLADSERKIRARVDAQIDGIPEKVDERIRAAIAENFTDELAATIDRDLSEASSEHSRRTRVLDHLDDMRAILRRRLEGAVGEAERSMRQFSFLAAGCMIGGLGIAGYRAYAFDPASLPEGTGLASLALQSAPWIAFVLLLEFTAILFFRRYTASLNALRTFSQAVYEAEMTVTAARMTVDYGTQEQVVTLSRAMLDREWTIFDRDTARPRRKLQSGIEEAKTLTGALKGLVDEAKALVSKGKST